MELASDEPSDIDVAGLMVHCECGLAREYAPYPR